MGKRTYCDEEGEWQPVSNWIVYLTFLGFLLVEILISWGLWRLFSHK